MLALFIPYGHALSHVSRLLEIAREVQRRGGEPHFGGSGKYLKFAERAGFPVHRLEELDHSEVMRKLDVLDFSESPERIRKFVGQEVALMKELKPAVVTSDCRITAGISAAIAGVAHCAVVNAAWTAYYDPKVVRPFQDDFLRQKLIKPILPWVLRKARPIVAKKVAKPFNDLLKEHGLPPISHVHLGNQFTFVGDVPEFAPLENPPKNMVYVGPLIWSGAEADPLDEARLNPEWPCVYITWGSTGPDNLANFYKHCAEKLGGQMVNVIVTTGGQLAKENWPQFPPNFIVAEYLKGQEVLARCRAVVCHSGSGTLYQAFQAGVPVVGVPVNNEQRMHGMRVEDLRLGKVVDFVKLKQSFEPLFEALDEVMTKPEYQRNAQAMAKTIAGWNAPSVAADYLEKAVEAYAKGSR